MQDSEWTNENTACERSLFLIKFAESMLPKQTVCWRSMDNPLPQLVLDR